MNSPSPLPAHYGLLLALCLAGLLALWWFLLGSRHVARRRLLRRRIEALDPPADTAHQAAWAATRAAALQTRETLLRSPARRGRHQPLYDLPWLLFLGDEDADLPALLRAARGDAASEPAPPAGEAPASWRWHPLRAMVAIEASPLAAREPASPHERGLWLHAMLALADQRERLPLNGIVACISAAALLNDGPRLATDAQRLRQRIDEAAELLRLDLPVYLLVTGLDRLPGYAALRRALPAPVRAQALGHRLPDGATAADLSDAVFEPLASRLHALRMGLLRNEPEPSRRHAIHAFIEQLQALQPGLRIAAQQLFGHAPGPAHARWRGLYLVAASAMKDEALFVSDLFRRFLPADQPLAK